MVVGQLGKFSRMTVPASNVTMFAGAVDPRRRGFDDVDANFEQQRSSAQIPICRWPSRCGPRPSASADRDRRMSSGPRTRRLVHQPSVLRRPRTPATNGRAAAAATDHRNRRLRSRLRNDQQPQCGRLPVRRCHRPDGGQQSGALARVRARPRSCNRSRRHEMTRIHGRTTSHRCAIAGVRVPTLASRCRSAESTTRWEYVLRRFTGLKLSIISSKTALPCSQPEPEPDWARCSYRNAKWDVAAGARRAGNSVTSASTPKLEKTSLIQAAAVFPRSTHGENYRRSEGPGAGCAAGAWYFFPFDVACVVIDVVADETSAPMGKRHRRTKRCRREHTRHRPSQSSAAQSVDAEAAVKAGRAMSGWDVGGLMLPGAVPVELHRCG